MLTAEQFKNLVEVKEKNGLTTLEITFEKIGDEKIISYINDERKKRIEKTAKTVGVEKLMNWLYMDYQCIFLKSRGVEKFNLNNSYEELKKLY